MPTIAVCNGTARTCKYIIDLALERGYNVKALVRSTSRFYSQTKKHDRLTAYEWSNLNDVDTLEGVLKDVSTLYVALGTNENVPTTMNKDCVESACAALTRSLPKGGQSPTKMVVLTSWGTHPLNDNEDSIGGRFLSNHLLNEQFDDLRRTQRYLEKQKSWLQYVILTPGGIVDVEESAETRSKVRVAENEAAEGLISYGRLGTAMFEAGENEGDEYNHKYMTPNSTSKVSVSLGDFKTQVVVIRSFFWKSVFPFMFRSTIFGLLCVGLGYYTRMREQGGWIAANLGIDLR